MIENYLKVESESPFLYKPICGGFEIRNGRKNYTRPIYPPHMNDDLLGVKGKKSTRFIYYLGDQPKLALQSVAENVYKRHAHIFMGIKGGKWLDEMENITARYRYGHVEYEISDVSFEGTIRLTYTRSDKLDAIIIKAKLPDCVKGRLTIAFAGQNGAASAQPVGGNSAGLEFSAFDTKASVIEINNNIFQITGTDDLSITGTADIPMHYTVKDAAMYEAGIDALLNSNITAQPMLIGTTEGNTNSEIYFLLTTEHSDSKYISEFNRISKEIFDSGISYYKRVSETVKINTPDQYLNACMVSQMMATDASWDWPSITHGPMGWHVAFGGWRSHYGFVDAGWGDRIKSNAKQFMQNQNDDGRIWVYPYVDDRYNMNLVLVDGLLQYWEWSGDNDFFANEGGYDFIAGHLRFMDSSMQVPGTNLYENWLEAWNTDNKWNNGGAGSIATAYTWRAYSTMARLASRLGKSKDSIRYQEKADAIKADMNTQLWDKDTGVFGEYKERFGCGRLNTAPDLSSVYTPIDMGITTPEQAYQMLRYTEYAIPSAANQENIWQGIDFKYSSNRLPEYYSSNGLYVQEVINNSLAYFTNGQKEQAMKQLRACFVPMMKGNAAGLGTVGHILDKNLENKGHIDFADTSTQYVRVIVEGLFGIKMNIPDGIASITPGLPADWNYASISTSYLSYDYRHGENRDIFVISSEKMLNYAMHIPSRSSKVISVKVNGIDTNYTLTRFVNFTAPAGNHAKIEIVYATDELIKIESSPVGGVDTGHTVKTNGIITDISDPQGVTKKVTGIGTDHVVVTLGEKTGNHTFFVTVKKNDMLAVLPVNLVISDAVEITEASIVVETSPGICVKLTNNTEKEIQMKALLSTVSDSTVAEITIPAKSSSDTIYVPVKRETDLTPGNNQVTAVLTGDIDKTITAEATDWQLSDRIPNSIQQFETISIDRVVNQNLRTLHENTYDITYEDNEHYRLPNFYWSSDTPRTVLANGRSWWEPGRGSKGVPASLNLPSESGICLTDIGVPFYISSVNGCNAAFVSLYNQFPDKINIAVNTKASKIYFMLCVSTNNMQSRIENARITVNLKDGTRQILALTNPDNIDDWLNYQQKKPYAESGYIQMLDSLAHANILAIDIGAVRQIECIEFECLSNEVLAGILGITVVRG